MVGAGQPGGRAAYTTLDSGFELLSYPAVVAHQEEDVAAENGAAGPGPELEGEQLPPPASRHWRVPRSRVSTEEEGVGEGPAAAAAAAAALLCWGGCDDRARTTALVNCSSIMERVDEQLLPALYRFVGKSFQATPSQLGVLTLSRALVQALASPLAGVLGHYVNRIWVLTAGAVLWGTMTALFTTASSVKQGIPFWSMNGIGLSFLIPAAQSLTADYNLPAHRGKAFGLLYFTGAVGALLGALYATNIGATRPLGLEGWRFAFLTVAAASWVIGALTWLLAVDPRYTADERYRVEKAQDMGEVSVRETLAEIWEVLSIPSFGIIITQGIVGTTPWNSLVFLTLFFQLLGMSDLQASALLAVFLAAGAAGGLMGGFIGDWAESRWSNHGRIVVCQFSVAIGVPLSLLLFKGLPLSSSPGATAAYMSVLATMGLTITWAAPACNNPIFSRIVPAHLSNLIYAFDRSFEGAIAACGAPLVGWLAERAFGFSGTAETTTDVEANLQKARSLGSALLVFTALPWALCALFFSGLHWTYPRDRRRAEEAVLRAHFVSLEMVESPLAAGMPRAALEPAPEVSAGSEGAWGSKEGERGRLLGAGREDSALAGAGAGALGAQKSGEAEP